MSASRLTVASATTATVGLVLAANLLRKTRQGQRRRGYAGLRTASSECRMLRIEERLEIRGLRNVGNSCFINAVLQSLASLQSFRNYLEDLKPPPTLQPFTHELLELMRSLAPRKATPTLSPSGILSPQKLHSILRNKVGCFGKDDQQDAQELFQMVMRLVGEEAALCLKNRDRRRLLPSLEAGGGGGLADVLKPKAGSASEEARPKNPLSGKLAYVRRCTVCDTPSTRMERFVDLSLTLPEARDHMAYPMPRAKPVDLATILTDFTDQQLVEDFECPTCAVRSAMEAPQDDQAEDEGWEVPTKRVRAHMRMLLGEPPQTLCLHFPRRHQSPSGLEMKLEQRVNFPTVLDVTPFCFGGGHHTDSIGVARAVVASGLSQLPGRLTKASHGQEMLNKEALSSPSSPPVTAPPLAKALLQPPQPRPVVKQALVGGATGGSRKELNGLANGVAGARPGALANGAFRGSDPTIVSMPGKEGVEYDLKAVIVHHGSADSGHYTAFRKIECDEVGPQTAGARKENWVDISDETINRVTERDVLASQAYMLFYRQIERGYCPGLG